MHECFIKQVSNGWNIEKEQPNKLPTYFLFYVGIRRIIIVPCKQNKKVRLMCFLFINKKCMKSLRIYGSLVSHNGEAF